MTIYPTWAPMSFIYHLCKGFFFFFPGCRTAPSPPLTCATGMPPWECPYRGSWRRRRSIVCLPGIRASSSRDSIPANSQYRHHLCEENCLLTWSAHPLCIGLIELLRDRSTDSVETVVKTMLAKAESRSSDVLEIRCDGEGTVGALIVAIKQQGVRNIDRVSG